MAERLKRRSLHSADWWFAYTGRVAAYVAGSGYPRERITDLQNSTDTSELIRLRRTTLPAVLPRLGPGPTALVLGSIYDRKRPEFVIAAADLLVRRIPGFDLLVAGDGPLRHLYDVAAETRPWLHVLGRLDGADLVAQAGRADLILNPGAVGLVATDAFALALPIATCWTRFHGPEFWYLRDDVDAVILPEGTSPQGYADEVERLLADPARLARLRSGCKRAAADFGIERMADAFVDGLLRALEAPPYRRRRG